MAPAQSFFSYLSIFLPKQQQASNNKQDIKMSSEQERKELDARAKEGEEVVKGGRGGKTLEAQEHLAEGRSKGGQTRASQLGKEGYQEMGKKGGLSTNEESGGEAAKKKGVDVDESKFKTKS
ncbi:hypothetical protein R1flu_006438 [Riccia fluitans]|uniref:Uncharacterized protein n=1 Tax=Riccia fluitans TaxID=41844 RepID=A0ABD1YYS5_9MARC